MRSVAFVLSLLAATAHAQLVANRLSTISGGISGATVRDVVNDFGATPFFGNSGDTTSDDTAAIQAAINSCPAPLVTFSGAQELGCHVHIPAGKYRIGNPGQTGLCCGGVLQGSPCQSYADCEVGWTPGATAAPTCAWLTTNGRPVWIEGDGEMATEIGVMNGGSPANDPSAIAICPGDNFSTISDIRLIKLSTQRGNPYYTSSGSGVASYTGRPRSNGIVVHAYRAYIHRVHSDAFGGMGIYVDGELSLANANGVRIDSVFTDTNAGDGIRLFSHPAWPTETGSGDGSENMVNGGDGQGNWGYCMFIRSSKSTIQEIACLSNGTGELNISGSGNRVTAYFEATPAVTCAVFDSINSPAGNIVEDLSSCFDSFPAKVVDRNPHGNNQVISNAGTSQRALVPITSMLRMPGCVSGTNTIFMDGLSGHVKKCVNGRVTDFDPDPGQPYDWSGAFSYVYRCTEATGTTRLASRLARCGAAGATCDALDVTNANCASNGTLTNGLAAVCCTGAGAGTCNTTTALLASGTALGSVCDFNDGGSTSNQGSALAIADNSFTDVAGSAAIMAWVRPTTDPANMRVLTKASGGGGGYTFLRTGASDQMSIIGNNGSDTTVTTAASSIPVNTWTHVAMTENDPTDTIQGYINGATSGASGTLTSLGNGSSILTLSTTTNNAIDYSGQLAEVAAINFPTTASTLSAAQICRICSCGIDGTRCECDAATPANYKTCSTNADCQDFSANGLCDGGTCKGINAATNPGCGTCTLAACNAPPPK